MKSPHEKALAKNKPAQKPQKEKDYVSGYRAKVRNESPKDFMKRMGYK